ncbi:MAG: VWA domain-containing protein [Hyphomicrobiales bacterium]|nr:VWA domain-containing protein [Hyphomicrobiales bacterium]
MFAFLTTKLRAMRASASGSAALMFAFASLALVTMVAVAIDFSQMQKTKAKVQAALDAAALAAANGSVINASNTLAQQQAASAAVAQRVFAAQLPGEVTTVSPLSVQVTKPSNAYQVALSYQGLAPQTFARILHFNAPVGGKAVASYTPGGAAFVNIYILVDVSTSMGLGADATDQSNMVNDTQINCAIACHGSGSGTDTIAIAKSKGYTLRIDIVRNAIQTAIQQAQATALASGATIQIGIYTFADTFNTLAPLSTNYGALLTSAANLDIATYDSGSSQGYALKQLNAIIQANGAGSGATASTPASFVMLLTDGVANATDNQAGNVWTTSGNAMPAYTGGACWPGQSLPADTGPYFGPSGAPVSGACVPNPYQASPAHLGDNEMQISPLDPGYCAATKALNVTLMTLYTTYVLTPAYTGSATDALTGDWRYPYIQQYVIPKIAPAMQACASGSSNAFVASDSASIKSAVAAMTNSALSSIPKLTR